MYGYEDQETFSYTGGPTIIEVPPVGPYTAAREMPMQKALVVVALLFIAITFMMPYIVIGVLTRFKPQSSTALQRGFMMAWLVVGQVSGFLCYVLMEEKSKWHERGRLLAIFVVLFGAPAIGPAIATRCLPRACPPAKPIQRRPGLGGIYCLFGRQILRLDIITKAGFCRGFTCLQCVNPLT